MSDTAHHEHCAKVPGTQDEWLCTYECEHFTWHDEPPRFDPSPQLIGHCVMCHLPLGHPDCKARG
jgi:hypothetical protein